MPAEDRRAVWACEYILHRQARRPCPGGDPCEAWERRRKNDRSL